MDLPAGSVDPVGPFVVLVDQVETAGTITFDHVVSSDDGEYLLYWTVTPDAVDTVTGLVESVPHWEAVRFYPEDDPTNFELLVSDTPVVSTLASRGGYVDNASLEHGDFRMTVHLAPSVDVRQVIDAVADAYPQAEMVRRRLVSRPGDDPRRVRRRIVADLTDRQRATIEAAYYAGSFEWPRNASGEEVADSLGIASLTFHQHLRKAQKGVLDAVLSESPGTFPEETQSSSGGR